MWPALAAIPNSFVCGSKRTRSPLARKHSNAPSRTAPVIKASANRSYSSAVAASNSNPCRAKCLARSWRCLNGTAFAVLPNYTPTDNSTWICTSSTAYHSRHPYYRRLAQSEGRSFRALVDAPQPGARAHRGDCARGLTWRGPFTVAGSSPPAGQPGCRRTGSPADRAVSFRLESCRSR